MNGFTGDNLNVVDLWAGARIKMTRLQCGQQEIRLQPLCLDVNPAHCKVTAVGQIVKVIGGVGKVTVAAVEQHFQERPAIRAVIFIARAAIVDFDAVDRPQGK